MFLFLVRATPNQIARKKAMKNAKKIGKEAIRKAKKDGKEEMKEAL